MTIKSNTSIGVVGYNIMDVNLNEMRQMNELKNTIKSVLDSHKPDSKEKKYISDNDLKLAHAIFSVFTKEYKSTQTSAFDDFLKEQDMLEEAKMELERYKVEQPQQEEKKPTFVVDDDLYGGE